MTTRVSTKGQVVLPSMIRKRLNILAGDELEVALEGDRVVMTPVLGARQAVHIGIDAVSGLPVLTAGPSRPILTSDVVEDILAEGS